MYNRNNVDESMCNLNRCSVGSDMLIDVRYRVTARSAMYDRHQATTMNHVPTQCTIIVILLLIIPIVTGACKYKYSI